MQYIQQIDMAGTVKTGAGPGLFVTNRKGEATATLKWKYDNTNMTTQFPVNWHINRLKLESPS
jgi:hypothetical protein